MPIIGFDSGALTLTKRAASRRQSRARQRGSGARLALATAAFRRAGLAFVNPRRPGVPVPISPTHLTRARPDLVNAQHLGPPSIRQCAAPWRRPIRHVAARSTCPRFAMSPRLGPDLDSPCRCASAPTRFANTALPRHLNLANAWRPGETGSSESGAARWGPPSGPAREARTGRGAHRWCVHHDRRGRGPGGYCEAANARGQPRGKRVRGARSPRAARPHISTHVRAGTLRPRSILLVSQSIWPRRRAGSLLR
jgi:hypothetical protein